LLYVVEHYFLETESTMYDHLDSRGGSTSLLDIVQQGLRDRDRQFAFIPNQPQLTGRSELLLGRARFPAIRVPGEQTRDTNRLITLAADVLGRTYGKDRVEMLFIDGTASVDRSAIS
jgi:hypothetical protein